MKTKKKYPRYFIGNNNWTITKYVYINKPDDEVRCVLLKNDKHEILDDISELDCDIDVKEGRWREVIKAELALII